MGCVNIESISLAPVLSWTMTERESKQATDRDWQARLAAHVGVRVRELRTAKRLSAQDVANLCTERLGFKLLRTTLANLEAGTRKSVTLGEVIALSEALDTSPAALLFPLTRGRSVEYLPDEMHPAWAAWDRFTSPIFATFGNTEGVPSDLDDETHAVTAMALLETLQNSWRMFARMRSSEHMPEGAKQALDQEMSKVAAGAAKLLPSLRELGVDLDTFDGDFLAAGRQLESEWADDAAPSA